MTAKKKKNPNFTQVNGRLLVDQYHEICMCPDCRTVLEAPGGVLPECSCGTDKMPLGAIARLTVDRKLDTERVLHVFVVDVDDASSVAVVCRENGKTSEHEIGKLPFYQTRYYESGSLGPLERSTNEDHARITRFIYDKLANIT